MGKIFYATALVFAATTAVAGCASSVNLTADRPDDPELNTTYLDTRVVVTKECPSATRPKFSTKGESTTTADVGDILGGLGTSIGGRIIDVGIDALSNFLKEQAKPSHGAVSAGSNGYLWVGNAGGNPYIGCVTLAHGVMNTNGDPGNFSAFWKNHAKNNTDLRLPLARDPQLYIEAEAVLSTDHSAISLVPVYLYYGEELDDRGADEKTLTVRYDLWSPSLKGKEATDQTLILGAGSFDIPAIEAPAAVTSDGFGFKHTPWFELPQETDGGTTPEAKTEALPAAAECLPSEMTKPCVRKGAFSASLSDSKASLPVFIHVTVTEDGGKNAFWGFFADIFSDDVATQTKTGLKSIVFPKEKTPEERTKELSDAATKAETRANAQREVDALKKTIAETEENAAKLSESDKRARLTILRAQLALQECKASGRCG